MPAAGVLTRWESRMSGRPHYGTQKTTRPSAAQVFLNLCGLGDSMSSSPVTPADERTDGVQPSRPVLACPRGLTPHSSTALR